MYTYLRSGGFRQEIANERLWKIDMLQDSSWAEDLHSSCLLLEKWVHCRPVRLGKRGDRRLRRCTQAGGSSRDHVIQSHSSSSHLFAYRGNQVRQFAHQRPDIKALRQRHRSLRVLCATMSIRTNATAASKTTNQREILLFQRGILQASLGGVVLLQKGVVNQSKPGPHHIVVHRVSQCAREVQGLRADQVDRGSVKR